MIDSLAMVEVIQHESIEGGFLQIDGHFVNQTDIQVYLMIEETSTAKVS